MTTETSKLDKSHLDSLSKDELIQIILNNQKQQQNSNQGNQQKKKKKRNVELDFDKCYKRYIALKVSYIGWDYHGFAAQTCTEETIEGHLFSALKKTCLIGDIKSANYAKSGRTDKGVSAFGQVISLYVRSNLTQGEGIIPPTVLPTPKERDPNKPIQPQKQKPKEEFHYAKMLNGVLPPYIRVLAWSPIPFFFNARFSTLYRTYKYYFNPHDLDINLMKEAGSHYLGEHDFSHFCKMDLENVKSFKRVILDFQINPVQDSNGKLYEATIKGYAFLWHQIRCMMAMLFLVGRKTYPVSIIKDLLSLSIPKPTYEMASEIPLVLYDCGYEDLQFNYDNDSHQKVIKTMFLQWNEMYIKAAVINLMKESLEKVNISSTLSLPSTTSNTTTTNSTSPLEKRKEMTTSQTTTTTSPTATPSKTSTESTMTDIDKENTTDSSGIKRIKTL
ncbi:hypothetical protein CYY_004180 [Polysphondylium violaceum]|uniref:Pseudouridine synthase I TruA alpha/beta domain-containing protein n=1 Tax=Polysphondylium violaceum TaxID=133409 RepID=A0A8J4PVL6_9MYCE|nr:hypothetical protein CYY_004180 [Polysphondylium violaceum]